MDNEQALKILRKVPLTSGYVYGLIQHFIESCGDDAVDEEDEDLSQPTDLEAGDLFRTLVLDESYSVDAAAEMYDAAMVIVRSADSGNQESAGSRLPILV